MVGQKRKIQKHVLNHYPIIVTEEVDTIRQLNFALKPLKKKVRWCIGRKVNKKYVLYRAVDKADKANEKFYKVLEKRIKQNQKKDNDLDHLYPTLIIQVGE